MTDFEFIIPLQKDELLESHVGQYHVEDVVQQRVLTAKLQDAVRAYNSKGVDFVFEHFDTYYSILVHGNKLEWVSINKGFEYVERACQQLCGDLETLFKEKDIPSDDRTRSLNCLKMLLYLHTSLMKVKDTKLQAEMAASLTIGKRGRKVAAAEGSEKDGEWGESERRAALDVLYNLLQLPLQRLWEPPLAEDTFVDMVAQPCYRAMEDVSIKNKTTRESVFQILGVLNKKYNHGISCTIKLVQTVQLYEHAVSAICAGIAQLVTVWELGGLVSRLVRELGEALGGGEEGGAGDSAPAQRHCAQLLTELTQLLPAQMLPAALAMRSHLESDECYPLRCSVLGMLCEVICRELKGEGLSEERKTMRDDFLDDLEEHLHDLSAYVRSKVLQYWSRLQREGCVPVMRQQRVLARCIGRLQDRATLVRKNAVQLVKVFIEHNPFSARLKLDILEEQLATEKKNLEALQSEMNPAPDAELVKKWEKMKEKLQNVIQDRIDKPTQDDPQLSQGSVNDAYATIRRHLQEKQYLEAFIAIRQTEKLYPEAKLFRVEMDKEDQVSYFATLLGNVFINNNEKNVTELEEANLISRIEEKENVVTFLEESVSFSQLVQQAVPLVYTLLMSKQASDVFEAIDFFNTAHSFNIESARIGIMGMLQLVWSHDQEKREAVEKAYRKMYLATEGGSERIRAAATATKLVGLVRQANRGHAAALQVLLGKWLQAGEIGPPLIQILWEMFTKKHEGTTEMDSRAALSLLVTLAKAKPSVASANIEVIQNMGLTGTYNVRVLSLQLLLSMGKGQKRQPLGSPLLDCLHNTIIESFFKMEKFVSLGTNSIDLIYVLCDTPDLMCIKLLKEITVKINLLVGTEDAEDVAAYPVEYLSRLVVLLGQIALQQLIYLDVTVYGELRRRNEVREHRKVAGAKSAVKQKVKLASLGPKVGRVGELTNNSLNSSSASASSRMRALNTSNQDAARNDEEDDDAAGLEGAVADDADAELVRSVCESEVVGASIGGSGLLAQAAPLLHSLLVGQMPVPPQLRAAACLALSRFMLVSSTFCEDNMQLLMTMLKNSKDSSERCNIVITLADLTLRFPNVIQPWTHFIYERLDDPCVEVRQCTVKMLSYLILQEMVRVRGQVAGLARCCVDDDPSTRTMARLFFKQLSQKGNSLYNIVPDIISRLSDPQLKLDEDHFRTILKFLMSLIQKDRQMEALVEKLCLRFKLSTDERQWRDLAYCLSLFNYNERSIKKLIEYLDCYKDKLFSKEVYECFKVIISNTNKNAKADLKTVVSELSDKIEECFAVQEAGAVDLEGDKNEDAFPASVRRGTPAKRRPANRGRGRRLASDDSDSDGKSDTENQTPVKGRNKGDESVRISARKRVTLNYQQKNMSDSSDEEENDDGKQPSKKKEVFKKPAGRVGRKRK